MLSANQEDTLTKSYQATFDALLNAAMDQISDTQLMPARDEQLGLVSQVVALKCVVLKRVPDIIKLINREEADRAADLYYWLLQQLSEVRRTARRSVRAAIKQVPSSADICQRVCALA